MGRIFYGWVWVGVIFFWVGVGGCDISGWVWVGVTLFWVGVAGCDILLCGSGWV